MRYELVAESLGGETLFDEVSAKKKTNLDKLNSIYVSAPQKALEQIQKFISDFDKVVIKQETVKKDDNIIINAKQNEDNVLSNKFGFDVVDLKFASSSEIGTLNLSLK